MTRPGHPTDYPKKRIGPKPFQRRQGLFMTAKEHQGLQRELDQVEAARHKKDSRLRKETENG